MATDEIGRHTRLPRVTLLMLFGVFSGPLGFDLVPEQAHAHYELLAAAALSETILSVTIATTIVFEIFGPIATRTALGRAMP